MVMSSLVPSHFIFSSQPNFGCLHHQIAVIYGQAGNESRMKISKLTNSNCAATAQISLSVEPPALIASRVAKAVIYLEESTSAGSPGTRPTESPLCPNPVCTIVWAAQLALIMDSLPL